MRYHPKGSDDPTAEVVEMLGRFFEQARRQFGDAVKSCWLYDDALCPACNQVPIGTIKIKGKEALSLNAFIYRQRGVLIGYFLCQSCAERIFRDAEKHPYTQTEVHAAIERNLIISYHAHLGRVNN
jgi:hypothetical protein